MKPAIFFLFAASTLVIPTQAQQVVECRDLAPNGYVAPNESVINGKACRPAGAPLEVIDTNATLATPAPSARKQPPPAPVASNSAAKQSVPDSQTAAPAETPTEPGMYLGSDNHYTKILGQIVDFKRSGSMLVSSMTLDIKSKKENVQLLSPHAQTTTGSSPVFYFVPARSEADAGVDAGDLVLVRLEEKKERRQFEIGAQGAWRASNGISLTHQVQLLRSEVTTGVYKVAPATELGRGEYGLYLKRGEGTSPYIYDFSVR